MGIEQTTVKPAGTVDITRKDESGALAPKEETMAEYAARREAEMRGEKPAPKVAPVDGDEAAKAAAAAKDKEEADAAATAKAAEEAKKKAEAEAAALAEDTDPVKLKAARDQAKADAAAKALEAEEAKKRAEAAQAEAERLKAEAEARAAERPVVPKAEDDPAPDRDQFDDPDQYEAAMRSHAARAEIRKANEAADAEAKKGREAQAKKQEEERAKRVNEQVATLHKTFNERVAKAKPDIPDYDEKVTNNEKLILRNDVFFTIEKSEMAPYLLHHLATNPEEAESLNKLDPIEAAIRLGEIQAEIRIARKPKPSNAKPPHKPLGQGASPERKTPDEETMDEFAQRRAREEAAARAARKNVRLLN